MKRASALLSFFLIVQLQANARQLLLQDTVLPQKKILSPQPTLKPLILPGALIFAGTWCLHNSHANRYFQTVDEHTDGHPEFHKWADYYIQFSPLVVAGILNLSGVKGKNTLPVQAMQLVKTELITMALVTSLKYTTHEMRPDGSTQNSFPSGHTAEAFAAATFLHKEFGQGRPWLSAFMYSVAASVGAMRVMNNRHWASDGLAGAGVGILSAEIAYHPFFNFSRHKTHSWTQPVI